MTDQKKLFIRTVRDSVKAIEKLLAIEEELTPEQTGQYAFYHNVLKSTLWRYKELSPDDVYRINFIESLPKKKVKSTASPDIFERLSTNLSASHSIEYRTGYNQALRDAAKELILLIETEQKVF
jgi:hypothetical protein